MTIHTRIESNEVITNLVIERISEEGFRRFAAEIRDLLALPNMSSDYNLDEITQRTLVQRFEEHCKTCLEFNEVVMGRKAQPMGEVVTALCFLDQREFPWSELTNRAQQVGERVMSDYQLVERRWVEVESRPFPTTYGQVLSIGRQKFSQQKNCGDKTLSEFDLAMEQAGLLHDWSVRYRHGQPVRKSS